MDNTKLWLEYKQAYEMGDKHRMHHIMWDIMTTPTPRQKTDGPYCDLCAQVDGVTDGHCESCPYYVRPKKRRGRKKRNII